MSIKNDGDLHSKAELEALRRENDELKKALPLPQLMVMLGMGQLAKKASRCIFHNDKKASFSTFQNSGKWLWKCHAGCGSGQVDTDVTGEHSVVAFDLSAPALKIYERVHTDPHDLVRGTIFSIPIKNSSLDGIYHLGVMEHFAEQEIQQILSEFHRILKPGGKMVVFWPPKFGLSVGVLTLAHFVLNRILRRGVKLHPDEITLLRSRSHAVELFARARFAVDGYSFGIKDFFTYCMVVVSKLPETIIIDDESVAAD